MATQASINFADAEYYKVKSNYFLYLLSIIVMVTLFLWKNSLHYVVILENL